LTEVDGLANNLSKLDISAPSPKDKDAGVLECARALAVLTKVTACLDANSGQCLSYLVVLQYLTNPFTYKTEDLSKRAHEAATVLPGVEGLLCLSTEPNDGLHRAQGKLQRALERLRRACTKVLDGEAKVQSHVINSLLMAISTALEGVFKQVSFKLTYTWRN
jgi:separase